MEKKRIRDWGIPLPGTPGPQNAITDVMGVEVGYSTIMLGKPEDYSGPGSPFARTGVTAILPRGKKRSAVFAGRYDLNGNGEMTGTHWIDDSGFLHGPIMITNTNSVGIVRDSTSKWMLQHRFYPPKMEEGQEIWGFSFFYPCVGETWDGHLNDTNGFHVKEEHVFEALDSASGGAIAEGNVGGGTGMACYRFKGGTGTSSRKLPKEDGAYTVGVLVQANHGRREDLMINGIPVGEKIQGSVAVINDRDPEPGAGSLIVVIATDAPLLPIQLSKMCRRASMGMGQLGGGYQNGSGDIFIAFSTANEKAYHHETSTVQMLSDEKLNGLYRAVAQAVEEAILNALAAAETMVGKNNTTLYALPCGQVVEILKQYHRM